VVLSESLPGPTVKQVVSPPAGSVNQFGSLSVANRIVTGKQCTKKIALLRTSNRYCSFPTTTTHDYCIFFRTQKVALCRAQRSRRLPHSIVHSIVGLEPASRSRQQGMAPCQVPLRQAIACQPSGCFAFP
jgi:hypothetical protein